jgi:hypothetical protein
VGSADATEPAGTWSYDEHHRLLFTETDGASAIIAYDLQPKWAARLLALIDTAPPSGSLPDVPRCASCREPIVYATDDPAAHIGCLMADDMAEDERLVGTFPAQCAGYAGDPGASAPRCESYRGHLGRHFIRWSGSLPDVPADGKCPTCDGPVAIERTEHSQHTIVGREQWSETNYRAVGRSLPDVEELAEAAMNFVGHVQFSRLRVGGRESWKRLHALCLAALSSKGAVSEAPEA